MMAAETSHGGDLRGLEVEVVSTPREGPAVWSAVGRVVPVRARVGLLFAPQSGNVSNGVSGAFPAGLVGPPEVKVRFENVTNVGVAGYCLALDVRETLRIVQFTGADWALIVDDNNESYRVQSSAILPARSLFFPKPAGVTFVDPVKLLTVVASLELSY